MRPSALSCEFDEQLMSWDTAAGVVAAMAGLAVTGRSLFRGRTAPKQKAPGFTRGLFAEFWSYRFAVLSRQVRFAAAHPVVVGATVMSPRAVIV